jgi:hypothetical protein
MVTTMADEFSVDAKANAITEVAERWIDHALPQAERVMARIAIGTAVEELIDECRAYYRAQEANRT